MTRHQRTRIVVALCDESVERGYRNVTVADVVKRAGVARKTFYDNFGSKDDCFLAAQEYAMNTALERVTAAADRHQDWPLSICAGLDAFLEFTVEEPVLARACLVEALAAGAASLEYYEEAQQAFVSLFRLGRDVSPTAAELPETLEEAIVGGVFWIVHQRLALSGPQPISDLLSELVEFVLTPYLGAEEAQEVSPKLEKGIR